MKKKYKYILIVLLFSLFAIFKDNIYFLINKLTNYQENSNLIIDVSDEYKELLKLTNLNNPYNYKITYSKVINRDIYNFNNEITILKGTSDGIKESDLVLNEYGLIGIITKVYDNRSIVTLLTNKKINLSIKVNSSYGILKSKNNKLIITNLTNDDLILLNDTVSTSGIGNYIGKIPVGYIDSENIGDDLNKEFVVTMYADLSYLNYVYIVGNEI